MCMGSQRDTYRIFFYLHRCVVMGQLLMLSNPEPINQNKRFTSIFPSTNLMVNQKFAINHILLLRIVTDCQELQKLSYKKNEF